jgi:hypothetical protein
LITGHCTHHKNHLKKLETIIQLTDRLYKDDYLQTALLKVEREHGAMEFENILNLRFKKSKNEKMAFKMWDIACKHSDYMVKQDREALATLMAKWNPFFWD